jgi:hypothetical protein
MTNSEVDNVVPLGSFLRELAKSIESNDLPEDQLKCVSEFYMSYKFHEKRNGNSTNDEDEFPEKDVAKFITLGWYIYNFILEEGIVP